MAGCYLCPHCRKPITATTADRFRKRVVVEVTLTSPTRGSEL
ncbi:hypothetical protein ACWGCW_33385 [Streptomyces sp. NPDC054933]